MRGVVLGLTGGAGSGKTALALLLRRRGAVYYSVDEAAHVLYRPGTPVYREVVRAFGPGVLTDDGVLDRGALGARVFGDGEALRRLNAIVHPALRREAAAAVSRMRARHPLVAVEAGAILFDLGLERFVDRVVLVRCARAARLTRLTHGRGLGRTAAVRLLEALGPAERRLERSVAGRRGVLTIDTGGPPGRLAAAAARIARQGRR